MAGGNLGDLKFTLGLDDKVSSAAKKISNVINEIDTDGKSAQRNLRIFANIFEAIGGNAKSQVRSVKLLDNAITSLQAKIDAATGDQKIRLQELQGQYQRLRDVANTGFSNLFKGLDLNKSPLTSRYLAQYRAEFQKLHSSWERLTSFGPNNVVANKGIDNLSRKMMELVQRSETLPVAVQRYQKLFDVLGSLRSVRSDSVALGVDTSRLDVQIARTLSALKELRSWMTGSRQDGVISGADDRSLSLTNRVISEQQKLNSEKRESVRLEEKHQQEIAKTAGRVRSELVRAFEQARDSMGKTTGAVQDLKNLLLQGGIVYGAQQFLRSIIETGGQLEQQHIALQTILSDMQNANSLFGQVQELALNSPFTFSELNKDVKQLAAYGVEYRDLYDTTKRLADMASGLGVSFERIALAFGQVQARGWLDGKELRQIAYAGIPLLDKLSKYYSRKEGRKVSTSEIKTRISARGVDFEDVKNIFWQMTDAGGQFYNMQQTLSETLLGRWNKLKDAWEIMLSEFANGKSVIGGTLMTAIDGVTALVQAFHSLAPLVAAAMSGFALKKLTTFLGGGVGTQFLSNKGGLASELQRKVLLGEQLTSIESRLLATKSRITTEDLQQLSAAHALTANDVRRLRISGHITAEQYRQAMAMTRLQSGSMTWNMEMRRFLVTLRSTKLSTLWSSFATSATAAFGIIATGVKGLASTLWSAIGGLPGMIITAVTVGIGYLWNKNEELKQSMGQTASEISDRMKGLSEFLRDNPIVDALGSKDSKAIDNLVESYKEKLKDIAGASYEAYVMTANEKTSQEERLRYLREQLELLRSAESIAKSTLDDTVVYQSLKKSFSDAKEFMADYSKLQTKANMANASDTDKWNFMAANDKLKSGAVTKNIVDTIKRALPDLKNDPVLQAAAEQIMESMMSAMKIPEDQKNVLRVSVMSGLGIQDNWLKRQVGQKMDDLVREQFPKIAEKIRRGEGLTDAEKAQVSNLMRTAQRELEAQYPGLESEIQRMLSASNFTAVIHLVASIEDPRTPLQKQLSKNIKMNGRSQQLWDELSGIVQGWAKGTNSAYDAANTGRQAIDKAFNDYTKANSMFKKGKVSSSYLSGFKEAYDKMIDAYFEAFGEHYDGKAKKSNKTEGHKEDKALKNLRERVALYKKMYAEIRRYKSLFGAGALGQLSKDGEFGAIFNDKSRFPLSDYADYKKSIEELLGTLPGTSQERLDFKSSERADIQGERRKDLEESRRDELSLLNSQLDVIEEQYATYKKIYELTGNRSGAMRVAFGNSAQSDSFKKYLMSMLSAAVAGDNVQSGQKYSVSAVAGMSLRDVKQKYGESSRTYVYREKLEKEENRIKKESVDLLTDLIEKNATLAQQIDDENLRYERQKKLISEIADPSLRQRATEGNDKTHSENLANLQFEQFKQESDWVAIFDDLARVSTATIDSMVDKIDDFSRKTGLSVEVVKRLRDSLEKLRKEQIARNPLPNIFGGVRAGNAIGRVLQGRADVDGRYTIDSVAAKRTGLSAGKYTKTELENYRRASYADSSSAIKTLSDKMNALAGVMQPVVDLFAALGDTDSVLSQVTGGATSALSSAGSMAGNIDNLSKMKGLGFLKGAGPYAAVAAAALSVGSTLIKAFGADYSKYNKAKAEYDRLVDVWDKLIQKKKEYLSESWGGEAKHAADEAAALYASEIAATKELARVRLSSGASIGSHSIRYRMWKGSYKDEQGRTWKDVAPAISRALGVSFTSMDDMLNMTGEQLEYIMKTYPTLWAHMDGGFRDSLEKIMDIRDAIDDTADTLTEKLTGMNFKSMVENWSDAMTQMSNGADVLVDNVEDGLKKAIVSGVLNDLFKDKISALIKRTNALATNDAKGPNGSTFTKDEWTETMGSTEALAKEIEAIRDQLKQYYGWSDSSSSKSRNSVSGITEEQADILASYVNAIRLDVSVGREQREKLLDTVSVVPEMNEIAKSQLTQLVMIADNTQRNADAAEAMLSILESVTTSGRKRVYVS